MLTKIFLYYIMKMKFGKIWIFNMVVKLKDGCFPLF